MANYDIIKIKCNKKNYDKVYKEVRWFTDQITKRNKTISLLVNSKLNIAVDSELKKLSKKTIIRTCWTFEYDDYRQKYNINYVDGKRKEVA